MTRPQNLKTKIFLDGGDAEETKKIIDLLGFIDGQTTNPTLVSKNHKARERLERGAKFSRREEIFKFYQELAQEIAELIPAGSISVEVYADKDTMAEEMLRQAEEMFSWIPNAHIKFPITAQGLKAAEQFAGTGKRVNMTLCFSQEQAAAVYAATKLANKGKVFVSPFVGRLDDFGENGMSLVKNIIQMYKKGDGHVEALTASVRSLDHFLAALALGSDIITSPAKILKEWAEKGFSVPDETYRYNAGKLKEIPYKDVDLSRDWEEFNIAHELTDKGLEQFSADWNALNSRI